MAKNTKKPQRFKVDPFLVLSAIEGHAEVSEAVPELEQDAQSDLPADQKIKILSLDIIEPDPWNPRHVLPNEIREKLLTRKYVVEKAARAWVKMGETDPNIASELQDYRLMGATLLEQGQINPINVAKHYCKDGSFVWRIESGERRFWAKWLLVVEGITDDRTIHAVLLNKLNPTRQAIENIQTKSLSAVGDARQIARLYLEQLGVTPDCEIAQEIAPGCDEYFRIALRPANELLEGRKRLPRGFWAKLENTIGNKRQHLERKLQILRIPDETLSLAESYRLTEKQLREIILHDDSAWEKLIQLTFEFKLTGSELERISDLEDIDAALQMILDQRSGKLAGANEITAQEKGGQKIQDSPPPPEQIVLKRVVSVARFFGNKKLFTDHKINVDRIVDDIIQSGDHLIVLENLRQFESILDCLKDRVAQFPDVVSK
jgi:hypothetical protein